MGSLKETGALISENGVVSSRYIYIYKKKKLECKMDKPKYKKLEVI